MEINIHHFINQIFTMKNIHLFLYLFLAQFYTYSQSCIPGSLILSSQAEVDAFPANYPGCTIIEGNIAIKGTVQNLNGLSQITRINETLLFSEEVVIQDFSGLNNLQYVGGSIYYKQDYIPGFINVLPGLDTVMGDIKIEHAIPMTSGLQKLKHVGKSALIYFQAIGSSMSILDSLTFVGEDLSLIITSESVFGLDNLQFVGRDMHMIVYGDTATICSNLLEVGRDMNMQYFKGIGTQGAFFGFERLKKVGGYYFAANQDMFGLDSLISIKGEVYFSNTHQIGGVNNLDTLHGNFTFVYSSENYLPDFPNLKLIKGEFKLEDLTFTGMHLKGFGQLDSILGAIRIINTGLDSITAFANLEYVDSIFVNNNDYLTVIDGLDHSVHIQKSMEWSNNPFLYDCAVKAVCDKVVIGQAIIFSNGVGCNTPEEVMMSCPTPTDTDNDLVPDVLDNCINVANPDQADCNGNGIGNACDTPDNDCDGIPNAVDNCMDFPNMYQIDNNNNGIGDVCEQFTSLGINTNNPLTELHLSNGTLYIDNPEKSIIFKDYSGLCYMLRIRQGNLVIVEVPCPQ